MKANKIENKSGWLVGGGILASIIASLCCVGPLILTLLGVLDNCMKREPPSCKSGIH